MQMEYLGLIQVIS